MRSPSEVARFPLVGVALAIALVSCESDTTQPVEQPAITLSVATAELAAVAAGVDPAPLTLSVLNSGGGELTGLDAAVTYAAGQPTGWLTAALSGTTAPGTLTLTAVVGAIGAGTHERVTGRARVARPAALAPGGPGVAPAAWLTGGPVGVRRPPPARRTSHGIHRASSAAPLAVPSR